MNWSYKMPFILFLVALAALNVMLTFLPGTISWMNWFAAGFVSGIAVCIVLDR